MRKSSSTIPEWLDTQKIADEITYEEVPGWWPREHDNAYYEAEPSIVRQLKQEEDDGGMPLDMLNQQPPFRKHFPPEDYTRRSLFPIVDVASEQKQSDIEKELEMVEVEDDPFPEFTRELSRDQ